MPKTKPSHNLPTWFEEKGYWLSDSEEEFIPRPTILYREEGHRSSIEIARWYWTPSMTSVIEAVKEFENDRRIETKKTT